MYRILTLFLLILNFNQCLAHGSLEVPISRIYNCFKENPEQPRSEACKAAVSEGGQQPIYDWNGINQAAANDKHQQIIPDGQLCSAGREFFKGMNNPGTDWPVTTIMPDANGQFEFVWHATAPHTTKYFKFYMTRPGYNFSQPLKWSDLDAQPFCTITNVVLTNARYKMLCPLPHQSGRQIIFVIWQRSDSPEAFYACSDVMLSSTVHTQWKLLSDLYTHASVVDNTKITFRLFKHGDEVETVGINVTGQQTGTEEWPYYLAKEVNAKSSLVHIGVLNAQTGVVEPVVSSISNKVYLSTNDLAPYHYGLDFIVPGEEIDYIYPDSIEKYTAETIVLGRDQKRYQCKAWPASGWCSQSPFYYEPGRGIAWQMAWDLL